MGYFQQIIKLNQGLVITMRRQPTNKKNNNRKMKTKKEWSKTETKTLKTTTVPTECRANFSRITAGHNNCTCYLSDGLPSFSFCTDWNLFKRHDSNVHSERSEGSIKPAEMLSYASVQKARDQLLQPLPQKHQPTQIP